MPQLSKKNFVQPASKKSKKTFKSPVRDLEISNTQSLIEKRGSFNLSSFKKSISLSEVYSNDTFKGCNDVKDMSLTPTLFDEDDVDVALKEIETELDSSLGPDPGVPLSQEILNRKDVKDAYVSHCQEFLKDEDFSLMKKFSSKRKIIKDNELTKNKKEDKQKKQATTKLNNDKENKNKSEQKRRMRIESFYSQPNVQKKKIKAEKKKGANNNNNNNNNNNGNEFKSEIKIKEKEKRQVVRKSFKNDSKIEIKLKRKAKQLTSKSTSSESIKENISKKQTLSLKEKAVLLQESRNTGLYVLCDTCDKARYLAHVVDPLDLPKKWYCNMNSDNNHNKCSDPEAVKEDEEFLIDNIFNAGSIVWAKMDGFPWWPAMVEDDPDLEQYFWLEKDVLAPTQYHVTFFDSAKVTRAWLLKHNIKPFKINMNNPKYLPPKFHKYYSRIEYAIKEAQQAIDLPLLERLKKYCFINRYSKPLDIKPKKKQIQELKKSKGSNDQNKSVNKRKLSKIISIAASDGINDNLSLASDELGVSLLESLNWNLF